MTTKLAGATPGPWYAKGSRQPLIASETDPNGRTIALVYDHCDDAERDANARLIAEAPAMRDYLDVTAGILAWAKDHGADAAAVNGLEQMRSALLARIDGGDSAPERIWLTAYPEGFQEVSDTEATYRGSRYRWDHGPCVWVRIDGTEGGGQ